jgi:small subunit ribosomal protein S4e
LVKALKRLLAPEFWKVPKKVRKWVVSPRAGPHPKFYCIPLQILVRDILKLVETGKEARTIIKKGEILVDTKPRKDHAYPVGLFDVISMPRTKQNYRVVPDVKGLALVEIPEKEADKKICKIENKTILKKGKLQLNLHDGKNLLTDNKDYKTGDSILIELTSLKILQHLALEKGNIGIVSEGANVGRIGKIVDIVPGKMKEDAKIVCEIEGKTQEILKERFVVVGKDKPLVTVE